MRKRAQKKQVIARALALFMAGLMVLSMLGALLRLY